MDQGNLITTLETVDPENSGGGGEKPMTITHQPRPIVKWKPKIRMFNETLAHNFGKNKV